jgi:hypothetical protein
VPQGWRATLVLMEIAVLGTDPMRVGDGTPVRAASAVARLDDGWLVVQDDSTHAVWWRGRSLEPLRILPPVDGHDTFEEARGTKHLKPDLEAACEVLVEGRWGVLMLGSGSSPARMRAAVVTVEGDQEPTVAVADLTPVYAAVAAALDVTAEDLNMEGACVLGPTLRWFHRGLPSAGLPTGSIDVSLRELLEAVLGGISSTQVPLGNRLTYDLGSVSGVGLAVTDAVTLRDGSVLVSTVAEDTPNPRDDGAVVGSSLAVLDGAHVTATATLPVLGHGVSKVEGLALVEESDSSAHLLATVDADDPDVPSLALRLQISW